MKFIWHGEARRELREALGYYREQAGRHIAEDFKLAAMRAAERLLDYPDMGAKIGHGVRRSVLHDYPYTLIYRATAGSLIVIAVAHHSRRPGYWAGRR